MRPEKYDLAGTRQYVNSEFSRYKRLRAEFGEDMYLRTLGEKLVDGLVLLTEGSTENIQGLGLEFVRKVLKTLVEEKTTALATFAYGVRLSLYEHDNPLAEESRVTGEKMDPRLILESSVFIDAVFARLADVEETSNSALLLTAQITHLLVYEDHQISQLARGLYAALAERHVIS